MNYQNPVEFEKFLACVAEIKPRMVLEIGSLHGETLSFLMSKTQPGGTVISIDQLVPAADPRYEKQKMGHELQWHLWAKQAQVNFFCFDRDSRDQLLIDTVGALVPDLDVLFIDGGHDFATCRADWENYGPMVRRGGIVAFHDLGQEWPEVRRVWEAARLGAPRCLEFVESPQRYGIGVLCK